VKVKSVVNYSLSFALTVFLMYLAFRGKDMGQLWASISAVPLSWFVILSIGGMASHLARAWRWQYLLSPIKPNVTLRNSFSAVMIGILVNNVLPRVGEVVRPVAIGRLEKISRSAAFGTVVLERIIDMITFVLILLVVLFFYASSFMKLFPSLANIEWLFLAGSGGMLILCTIVFLNAEFVFSFLRRIISFMPKAVRAKIENIIESFLTGFGASKQRGNYIMIAVSSLAVWVAYIVLMYLPFYAFNMVGLYHLDFSSATILMVVSGFAYLLPTPSGFGSYHLFTTVALSTLFGVDTVTASSYALYTHSLGFISTNIVGLYYLLKDKIHVAEIVGEPESSIV
jgi:glycosyltransferase 2 family protein